MFVISDNTDTLIGMKLTGMEGVVVHTREDTIAEAKKAIASNEYGVILITPKLKQMCNDFFSKFMEKNARPLFLEIPDRHGYSRPNNSISEFIEKSIGLKLGTQKQKGSDKPNGKQP